MLQHIGWEKESKKKKKRTVREIRSKEMLANGKESY